jgi:L-asparaginase
MQFDPAAGGAVPRLSGVEILRATGDLETFAELRPVEFARLPGPHMTPARMIELACLVASELARPEISGVVITHGTDTLEETAFLLNEVLPREKPVVLVGALRNSSEQGWDGPENLRMAVRVAAAPEAAGLGVLVAMAGQILAGSEVVKTATVAPDTFQNRNSGPLGYVERERIVISRRPVWTRPSLAPRLDERVELIPVAAGTDGRFIDFAREQGAQGLVLVALGCGNVPPAVVPAIERALRGGLIVIITSRCWRGRVVDSYAYEGAGRQLTRLGAILGGGLSAAQARIRLMLLLGNGCDPSRIRAAFAET